MAEFTRSLHTVEPVEARKRCLSATIWFRDTMVRLRNMPSPTRDDLEDAAKALFAEMAAELDRPRNFHSDHWDEEIRWNIKCSRDRIKGLDVQLRENAFDGVVKRRARDLTDSQDWSTGELTERERLFAEQLAARAEREQLCLLIHQLSNPHRLYVAEDQTFRLPSGSATVHDATREEPARRQQQLTVREAVTNYVNRQERRNLGKSQIEELSRALLWLREEVGDATPLASIQIPDLRTFRDDIARLDVGLRGRQLPFKERLTNVSERQVRSVTALRYWRSVLAFFAWCAAEQLLPNDPAMGLKLDMKKGQTPGQPPPFTREELERLFETPPVRWL